MHDGRNVVEVVGRNSMSVGISVKYPESGGITGITDARECTLILTDSSIDNTVRQKRDSCGIYVYVVDLKKRFARERPSLYIVYCRIKPILISYDYKYVLFDVYTSG